MPTVPKKFTVNARLETRALNVQAELRVFAISGKGHDSGWSKLKDGLRALGFQLEGDGSLDSTAAAELGEHDVQSDTHSTESDLRPLPTDSGATMGGRDAISAALAAMPDEAYGWLVLALQSRIWPDGLGGFKPESRASIKAVRQAATTYVEGMK